MAPPSSSESTSENSIAPQVVKNALQMVFGTMTSRILGLLRDTALTALFSRHVTDAWTAAFRLPNLFRRLLGEGSMSVSFIPVFIESKLESEAQAKELANCFFTLLLILLGLITFFGTLYSEQLLRFLMDDNYVQNVNKFNLTVRMAKIMFSFIFFISNFAYFMGILNALGRYTLAAMAPTFWNLSMLLFTFMPPGWFLAEGDGLAIGVVFGGFVQAAVLVPSLRRLGYLPKIKFNPFHSRSLLVFRNMVPGIIGTGLLQITTIVNLRFASHLKEGAISYIYLADRLLELPLSLVSVSLGTALLPTLSELWSRGERKNMADTSNFYLRLNLFVAIPAAIGLYFLALPIIEILFKRGKFNGLEAIHTAQVVQVYSFILISASCVRVLVPAYYAIKNTWYPAVVASLSLAVHIVVAPILMERYELVGLVSSSFFSASLNFMLLLLGLRFFVPTFEIGKIITQVLKFLPGALALGVCLQLYTLFCSSEDFYFKKLLVLGSVGLLGTFAYFMIGGLIRLEEHEKTIAILITKIKGRLRKS